MGLDVGVTIRLEGFHGARVNPLQQQDLDLALVK